MNAFPRCLVLLLAFAAYSCSPGEDEAVVIASKASYAMSDGNIYEARRLFQKATELRPEVFEYRVALAGLLRDMEGKEQASPHYVKALEIIEVESQQNHERVDEHIMLLVELGRQDEAKELLNERRERFPDSETVRLLLDNQEILFRPAENGDGE